MGYVGGRRGGVVDLPFLSSLPRGRRIPRGRYTSSNVFSPLLGGYSQSLARKHLALYFYLQVSPPV